MSTNNVIGIGESIMVDSQVKKVKDSTLNIVNSIQDIALTLLRQYIMESGVKGITGYTVEVVMPKPLYDYIVYMYNLKGNMLKTKTTGVYFTFADTNNLIFRVHLNCKYETTYTVPFVW